MPRRRKTTMTEKTCSVCQQKVNVWLGKNEVWTKCLSCKIREKGK